jgi:hypothetical protein
MKSLKIAIGILIVLLSTSLTASAMSHQGHGDHGSSHATHGGGDGMSEDGSMMIVGSMVSKGVKGMAHLKDVSAKMAEMGMKTTHHFMIAFIDENTGDLIETGTVALKVTNPDAKVGDPIPLMGMDGHFGADVTLDMGTKLADGTKRKYHFHHVVK